MRHIFPWISINGKIFPKEKAEISIFDKGFLYGYGVFTTLKVRKGIPLFWEKHEQRLKNSLEKLHLSSELSFDLSKEIKSVIEKNKIIIGGVRVTITQGEESRQTFVIHATTIEKIVKKVKVITVEDKRDEFKTIKTTYRAHNLIAQKIALVKKAQDALFAYGNNLIESTYANIYSFSSSGNVVTPIIEGKGLNGISRQILMEELPIKEGEIKTNTTDPMILVSSLSIRVVESIDGRKLKQNQEFINIIQNAMDKAEIEYIDENKI